MALAAANSTLSLRTLVVDDNHDAADTLARLVELQGNEVRIAYDGLSAVELARTFRPDLGLIDLQIPELDGFRLAKCLRELPDLNDMLLVAVTGFADRAHRTLAKEAGFDKYLVKPFSIAQLKETLSMAQVTRIASSQCRASSEELRKQSEALRAASVAVALQSRELQGRSSEMMRRWWRQELECHLNEAPWEQAVELLATSIHCRAESGSTDPAGDCWCPACVRRVIHLVMAGEPVSDGCLAPLLSGLRAIPGPGE